MGLFPQYKKEPSNIIELTPREHFIAHWMLSRIDPYRMGYAFGAMCFWKSTSQNRDYKISGRTYEEARLIVSENVKNRVVSEETRKKLREAWKIRIKRDGIPFLGQTHSEKTKQLIRDKRQKLIDSGFDFSHSEETKRKIGDANRGKKMPPKKQETIENHRQKLLGRKYSEEHRRRSSEANKGRKQKRHTCPHCNFTGGHSMKHWHFDNCKFKAVNK